MKKVILTSIAVLLIAGSSTMKGQDWPEEYLGLPGDNLNLYAVMDLFQSSETLEGFERNLNDENSRINNLDLNGDNLVDYITVSDYVDGNVHNIVLRVALNSREMQDVAVFTVIKLPDGGVEIQLIGDEALYGKNYIVEPIYDETPNPGYTGGNNRTANVTVVRTSYYDIAAWPVIRFIYMPSYIGWRSSWSWGYWPDYWSPWNPYYWHFYYGYHSSWHTHYYGRYRHWNVYRYPRYRDYYYTSVRVYSPVVVVNINNNYYRNTYSRPDQRRNGEVFYASTRGTNVSRSGNSTAVNSQSRRAEVPESARVKASDNSGRREAVTNSSQTRTSGVSNNQGNNTATRRSSDATVRSNSGNSNNNRSTVATQRSNSNNSANRSTVATQRSNSSNSANRSTVATQRSNSNSSANRSTVATQRSNSNNSANRNTVATQRSSSGSSRSSAVTPKTTTRSSSSAGRSSAASVQKSNSSSQKSSGSTQKSSSSSSSDRRKASKK